MAEYIDAELLMQKLSRMIDYCEKNKDKKFNALNVLFQVGDAIMDCPTADVVPKNEVAELKADLEVWKQNRFNIFQMLGLYKKMEQKVAMEIFAELETKAPWFCENQTAYEHFNEELAELKKKYTEGESNGSKQ